MAYCRLMLSPMPHAKVRSIDAKEALAMPGRARNLDRRRGVHRSRRPATRFCATSRCSSASRSSRSRPRANRLAQDAIDKIKLDLEELPFTVDPLASLFPGGPDARLDGNVVDNRLIGPPQLKKAKWSAAAFANAQEGQLPTGEPVVEWSYGDVDAGLAKAAFVLDETFVTAGMSHHSMEPRSAMAYWENGKCFVYGSSQSQSFVVPGLAGLIAERQPDGKWTPLDVANLVYVAETCGGGFGSKGSAYPIMSVPAHMSKKINRPVMMRISRAEEYFLGNARTGFQGRIKIGFDKTGRVTAADLFIVQENGPTTGFPDWPSAGDTVSLLYQPPAMRFRGLAVMTNTPPRSAQRGPGHNQTVAAIEPLIDKAAKQLGIDRYEIRKINGPRMDAKLGENRGPVTSCYLHDAREKGAALFNYEEKKKLSGKRNGTKVTGIGLGQAFHPAGFAGFDGIVRITPDGKVHLHSGVGNLGTYSHTGTSRVAAEVLKANWDDCIVERGDTRKNLPWNIGQFGSNTSFTMARSNYVAAMDALAKLKEIAAKDLGGAPEDYDIGDMKVFKKSDPSKSLTYAAAAQRAIELGGKYDGHEPPAGRESDDGRVGEDARGHGPRRLGEGQPAAHGATRRVRRELLPDRARHETGQFDIVDYLAVADCGTVIHPMGLSTQIKGGGTMGFGLAVFEHHIYDPQNGLPGTVSLYQAKPSTLSRRRAELPDRRGRQARPAEPARHEGHRRARDGRRRLGAALRDLGCARRPLLQPGAGHARSDHQRARRTAAVAQAAPGQYGLTLASE